MVYITIKFNLGSLRADVHPVPNRIGSVRDPMGSSALTLLC